MAHVQGRVVMKLRSPGRRDTPFTPVGRSSRAPDPRLPGRAEIIAAVPHGSRRIRSPNVERIYLEQLAQWQPLLELRPVARAHTLAVAKQLARHASYQDGTSRPTRTRLTSLTGCSLSTWQRARRRLEAWGFLGCVTEGTTPHFSPMALFRRGQPNTAAVYVICLPNKITGPPSPQVRPQTDPPTKSGRTSMGAPARAREARAGKPQDGRRSAAAQPLRRVAELLRKAAGQTISDGWIAWIWGPLAAAGWTPGDLTWAIDHEFSGAQHRYTHPVRNGVGWLRKRLGLWTGDDGSPLPSITQQRRAAGERIRAQAAQHRAAMAKLSAVWADPAPHTAALHARFANRESRITHAP